MASTLSAVPTSLFSPYKIGRLQLKNRIVVAPMCMFSAENGKMGAFHAMHVGTLATSGAGLIILEATAVSPEGRISPYCCGIWDDSTAGAIKAVMDQVRSYSQTPIAIQLAHAGRKASCRPCFTPTRPSDVQLRPGTHPDGWQTVAPSAIPFQPTENPPHALSVKEIHDITAAFASAAVRAHASGIDGGVELHFAHGYLAHEFLSPLSNTRTDEYGGSLENRMRMPLEVFQAVRSAVPAEYPVWVRISATDWMAGGWDLEESIVFCKALKELGCDAIHVSSGGLHREQSIPITAGYQLPHARAIREAVDINTIAVGLITEAEQAESIVVSGVADAVALGRHILFNPRWPCEAAHKLQGTVEVPPQFWRSEPSPQMHIFTGGK